jgi:hypothetical protein
LTPGSECKGEAGGDPKRSEEASDKAVWQGKKKEMQRQISRPQEQVPAAANAKASLEEIRERSLGRSKTSGSEREEMKQQQEQQKDCCNSTSCSMQTRRGLNYINNWQTWENGEDERMRRRKQTRQVDALTEQHVAEQTKKRVSDGNQEQNAVPSAAATPNKQK